MLMDVDLDEPAPSEPPGRPWKAQSASVPQHPSPPQAQTPLLSSMLPTNDNGRRAVRGKASYHFSVKRPRRNVVKRSIASIPTRRLEDIEEEKEMLLGFSVGEKRDGRDLHRAPRLALALFLLVCSAGGYRGVKEYLISRHARSSMMESEDVTRSFRGSAEDGEHRGALLISEGGESVKAVENIEEVPTLLFDETVQFPEELSNLASVFHEQYHPMQNKLFLWHLPRSGSTTITRIASFCLGLTIASDAGKSEVRAGGPNPELRIVEGLDGMRFANVDTSNPEGIALAKMLNIGQRLEIDLISSPYLWDMAGIFDEVHKGYMMAMFRHPIERAVSLYYSMRKNPHYEKQMSNLKSIEQYAKSSLVENNWMTRFLSNHLSGELTPEHEAIAKEVLRTKCIVGLLRDKTETMRRLEFFFNVKAKERSQKRDECLEKLLYWDWPGKNRHEPVVKGSEAWDILYKQNTFDLRLYEYAEQLFEAQGKLFPDSQLVS